METERFLGVGDVLGGSEQDYDIDDKRSCNLLFSVV
jgi:hypothetical protein